MNYYKKYLKYKNKYLLLKQQRGGDTPYVLNPNKINLFKSTIFENMELYLNPIHGAFLYGSGYITNLYHLQNINIINTNESIALKKICTAIPNKVLPTNDIRNELTPINIGRLIAIKYIFMSEKHLELNNRFIGIKLKNNIKSIIFLNRISDDHITLLTEYMLKSTPLRHIKIDQIDVFYFHLLLYCLWWTSNNDNGIQQYYKGINEVFTIANQYPYNDDSPRNYQKINLEENVITEKPSFEEIVIQIIQDEFKIISYHTAQHFCHDENAKNNYSDCGETTLRNFINLICYNNNKFDIDILIKLNAIEPVIHYYTIFNNFEKQMNEQLIDNITGLNSRDAWSKLIIDNMQNRVTLKSTCLNNRHNYEIQSGLSKEGNPNFFEAFTVLFPDIVDIKNILSYNIENITDISHDINNYGFGTIVIKCKKSVFHIYCIYGHFSMTQLNMEQQLDYDHLDDNKKNNIEILLNNKNNINKDNYLFFNYSSELLVGILNDSETNINLWMKLFELSLTEQYNYDTRRRININVTNEILFQIILQYIVNNETKINNLYNILGEYTYLSNNFNFLYNLPNLRNLNSNILDYNIDNIDLTPIQFINIESIGDNFLFKLNLKTINLELLGNIKKIGNYFLAYSSIETIDLEPLKNINSIGNYFLANTQLKIINLKPLKNINSIGNYFLANTQINTISLESLENVKIIGSHFLANTKINTISLEPLGNVEIIGSNFLANNKIKEISLEPLYNLYKIDSHFLANTDLEYIILSPTITKIGNNFLFKTKLVDIDLTPLSNIKIISDYFLSNTELTKIDLSSLTKIEIIGNNFLSNTPITEITFPRSLPNVKIINNNFLSDTQLTNIDLTPFNNIKAIGNNFLYYVPITEINLEPLSNVRKIGKNFLSGTQLTEINLQPLSEITECGDCFLGLTNISNLDLSVLKKIKIDETDSFAFLF
jgi:hypothetical protein